MFVCSALYICICDISFTSLVNIWDTFFSKYPCCQRIHMLLFFSSESCVVDGGFLVRRGKSVLVRRYDAVPRVPHHLPGAASQHDGCFHHHCHTSGGYCHTIGGCCNTSGGYCHTTGGYCHTTGTCRCWYVHMRAECCTRGFTIKCPGLALDL